MGMVETNNAVEAMARRPSSKGQKGFIMTRVVAALCVGSSVVGGIYWGITLGRTDARPSSMLATMTALSSATTSPTQLRATQSPAQFPDLTTKAPTLAPTLAQDVPSKAPTDPPTALATSFTSEPTYAGLVVKGVTSNGIDYLRCSFLNQFDHATSRSITAGKNIILLRGAAFYKEIWAQKHILESFCENSQAVIALDLPLTSGHQALRDVLVDLQDSLLLKLPVTLVAPSTSSVALVDWLKFGDIHMIPDYISEWVPVETGSLMLASDYEIRQLNDVPDLRVLAISGDDEIFLHLASNRLVSLLNATHVRLSGRTPVFLESPEDFVQAILNF